MTVNVGQEELAIATPLGRLQAVCWGSRSGIPTLALHGWLDNAASFAPLAGVLPGLQWLALDLPGHGHSQHHPPGMQYAFIDMVAEVCDAVAALAWDEFVLVGHSLGAGIAATMAGVLGSKVRALVLLEGLGPLTEEADRAPARFLRAMQQAGKHEQDGPRLRVHASLDAAAARVVAASQHPSSLASSLALSLASARTLVERGLQPVEGGFTWRADARLRLASRLRMTEAQVLAFLRGIVCPALLVRADRGFQVDAEAMRVRAAAVPDLTVAEVAGGHHVHMDDAATVGRLMLEFLARAGIDDAAPPGT